MKTEEILTETLHCLSLPQMPQHIRLQMLDSVQRIHIHNYIKTRTDIAAVLEDSNGVIEAETTALIALREDFRENFMGIPT